MYNMNLGNSPMAVSFYPDPHEFDYAALSVALFAQARRLAHERCRTVTER